MKKSLAHKIKNADAGVLIKVLIESCEKMLPMLKAYPSIYEKATTAINELVNWQKNNSIKAIDLYQHIYPLAILDDQLTIDSKEDDAFFSIVNALYYVICTIDGIERTKYGINSTSSLPSDMADVNIDTAVSSLTYAIKASNNKEEVLKWIEGCLL